MAKKVFSGHQPNFLPYMGVFYKMFRSDVFVLDDDVQYSNKGLHNANYIKVNGKKHKMTIPVSYKHGDLINQVKINYSEGWVDKLLKTVKMNYGKAAHFNIGYDLLERHIYRHHKYLVDLNIGLIDEIADRLCMKCDILIASKSLPTELTNNERNVFQCEKVGGDIYYSGTGGHSYNDEEMFAEHGIGVEYSDYQPLRYRQGRKDFIENLSCLDYIMHEGFTLPKEWRK